MNTQQLSPKSSGGTFSDRIRLLIQRVGSATEIARMCGFSEGVVRSWRDGNTDPSRARCVTLARTLGISLVWLVAGEGAIQIDPTTSTQDDQFSSEVVRTQRPRAKLGSVTQLPLASSVKGLDPQRLNIAMQILQSELDLANSPLSMADSTDLLTDLYAILGPGGVNVDATAMTAFNRHLAERVGKSRRPV
jgi:transcriptional regulator with XRE-family HTH domain